MSATVADLDTKTIENAKREFVELYGSALVMNTYLKIALVLVSLLSLGLLVLVFNIQAAASNVKPLVIRVDEVGRAEAVQYDATAYTPQAPELRYFLTQFVVKHFSRILALNGGAHPAEMLYDELREEVAELRRLRCVCGRVVLNGLGSADLVDANHKRLHGRRSRLNVEHQDQ
jgi:hypothetical protein